MAERSRIMSTTGSSRIASWLNDSSSRYTPLQHLAEPVDIVRVAVCVFEVCREEDV